VDGPSLDAAELKAFIDQTKPDVVALQTWAARHQRGVFGPGYPPAGWNVHRDGELFFASRYPIAQVRTTREPPFDANDGALAAYDVQAPFGTVHFVNLHLATPRRGLMAFVGEGPGAADEVRATVALRRRQTEFARRWVDEALPSRSGRVVALGDFNTPTDSAVYREFWSPFTNAFSSAGFGFGNTHFTEKTAIRIDHVLLGPGWACRRAWVGPHVGSGHRPVVADIEARGVPAGETHAAAAP